MRPEIWEQLTQSQRWTLVLSMQVRNTLEFIHADSEYGLVPDSIMPELNERIRDDLLPIVHSLLNLDKEGCQEHVGWLALMAPDYWEIPRLTALHRKLIESKHSEELYQAHEKASAKREAAKQKKWKNQALVRPEKLLVLWFKKLFQQRTDDRRPDLWPPDMRVTPQEVIAKMEALGFWQRGMSAVVSWGNIYRRAGLKKWCNEVLSQSRELKG